MEKLERINKYLSEAGVCSRRDVDELIETGRVEVNGLAARIGMQIDTERDVVTVDGQKVDPSNPYNNALSKEALKLQEDREPWWVEHNQLKAAREAGLKMNPKSKLLRKGKKNSVKPGKNASTGLKRVIRNNEDAATMNQEEIKKAVKKENRERKTFSDFFKDDKQGLMNVKTRRTEGVNPKASNLRGESKGRTSRSKRGGAAKGGRRK